MLRALLCSDLETVDASHWLQGNNYYHGRGVPQDDSEAVRLYVGS